MNKINRRSFLKMAAIAGGAVALTACGGKEETNGSTGIAGGAADFSDAPKVKMTFAENQPSASTTAIVWNDFCDKVKEATNGTVEIEFYPDALLGDEASVVDQIQAGAVGMARVNLAAIQATVPEVGAFTLPYMYRDALQCWDVMFSDIANETCAKCSNYGIKGLSLNGGNMHLASYGTRSFYAAEPLTTLEALKGKKIRVQESEVVIKMIECLGAIATPMAYGEVFQALQTGIVDAAENDPASYYMSGHYEVAKKYSMDCHQISPSIYIMAEKTWASMNERQQEKFMELLYATFEESSKTGAESVEGYIQAAKDAGCEFLEVETAPFQAACQGVYDMFPEYAEVIKAVQAM